MDYCVCAIVRRWEERLELLFLHQAQLQSQLEDNGVNLSAFYNQVGVQVESRCTHDEVSLLAYLLCLC